MDRERIAEVVAGVLEDEFTEAKKMKGKKKFKRGKDGSIPGPVIGYLIKTGRIRRKAYGKPGVRSKSLKKKVRSLMNQGYLSTKKAAAKIAANVEKTGSILGTGRYSHSMRRGSNIPGVAKWNEG